MPIPRLATPIATIAALIGAVIGARCALGGVELTVRDGHTGAPVAASIDNGRGLASDTGPDGMFRAPAFVHSGRVTVHADGFHSASVDLPFTGTTSVDLERDLISITPIDRVTGGVVPNAQMMPPVQASADTQGAMRIWVREPAPVVIEAPGYGRATVALPGPEDRRVLMSPKSVGQVISERDGQPVPNAIIASRQGEQRLPPDGSFDLILPHDGPAWVLAPGFKAHRVEGQTLAAQVRLQPFTARGLYLTLFAVADETLRSGVERLLDDTEANALIVDVKGDLGLVAYPTEVPLAVTIGADSTTTIPDPRAFLERLKARGIYTIARIVVFKDDRLARFGRQAGLDLAVRDRHSGEPWVDGEDLAWVDPFREESWEYNIALAVEAAMLGFDEIQFDYIRFPTDPASHTTMDAALFSREPTAENRVQAITAFLARAQAAVHRHGSYLGVDTFGYTPWDTGDMGIGQSLEAIADHVDYVCPMIYPSTFAAGLPGLLDFPSAIADPYRVVSESARRAEHRVKPRGAVVRPWLQYFDDYPWQTRRRYDEREIRDQIRAVADSTNAGWMLWDPSNRYSRGGLAAQPR